MSSNVFKCFGPKHHGSDSDPSQYIVECNQHNDFVSLFTFSIKYCIGSKNKPRDFDGSPHFEGFRVQKVIFGMSSVCLCLSVCLWTL